MRVLREKWHGSYLIQDHGREGRGASLEASNAYYALKKFEDSLKNRKSKAAARKEEPNLPFGRNQLPTYKKGTHKVKEHHILSFKEFLEERALEESFPNKFVPKAAAMAKQVTAPVQKRVKAAKVAAHYKPTDAQNAQDKTGRIISAVKGVAPWATAGAAMYGPVGAAGGALVGAGFNYTTKAIENYFTKRADAYKNALHSMNESAGHKVIDTFEPKGDWTGDRYELHAHNHGHPSAWYGIIKTHQGGKSTQNEHGGYNLIRLGTPKYVTKKWKNLKDHYNNPNVSKVKW